MVWPGLMVVGVGTGACPVTFPVGRLVYVCVGPGVTGAFGAGVGRHCGTSQHVGSLGSGTNEQP